MIDEWQFDEYRDGRWDGWNSSQLALFKDNRLKNLAREIIQNSLDNPQYTDGSMPVVVKFTQRKVDAALIPGIDSLREHLEMVVKAGRIDSDQSQREMVAALRMAQRETIPVLEISDEFTTGMAGPCSVGRPFHNYLKATGSSGGDQGRGGSHGQGKSAPLANSILRTIFVSTKFPSVQGQLDSLFQGRCVLMSRESESGNTSSVGFWGAAEFEPLESVPQQYSWMARTNEGQGTSLFVIGWDERKDWDSLIVAYAIESFFAAFQRGTLELDINGRYTVNKDNVGDLLWSQKLRHALETDGQDKEILDNAQFYYRCLSQGEAYETQITPKPGHSRLMLLVEELAPKRIAFVRNNILITDRIPHFYKNSPGSLKDFAGVYECLNDSGLRYLRAMEPPQHNALSADWLPQEQREDGNRLLRALGAKLKSIVKEKAEITAGEGGEIEILKNFFADDAGDGREINQDEDINPNGVFKLSPKPFKLPPPKPLGLFDEPDLPEDDPAPGVEDTGSLGGSRNGSGSLKPGSEKGFGPGEGSGDGGAGDKGAEPKVPAARLHVRSQRFIFSSPNEATLSFVPSVSGLQKLWVYEVGADGAEPIGVTTTTGGEIVAGKVMLDVTAGVSTKLILQFNRPIRGGLKVEVEA